MRNEQHDFAPYWEQAFIEGLKKERNSQGMSQVELAERMSDLGYRFDQATVYKIENGKRKVTAAEAWGLAEVLDVEVEYLYDYKAAHGHPEARAKLIRTQADKLLQELLELDLVARRMADTHRALVETIRSESAKGLQYESVSEGVKPLVEHYGPLLALSIHNEVIWRLRREVWVDDFQTIASSISGIWSLGPERSVDHDD